MRPIADVGDELIYRWGGEVMGNAPLQAGWRDRAARGGRGEARAELEARGWSS